MAQGMRCPECNCPRYRLLRTDRRTYHYLGKHKMVIRRRYVCEHCGNRWWSNEIPEGDLETLIGEE